MYVYFKCSSTLENVCVERHLPFQGLYYRGMVKTFLKHVFSQPWRSTAASREGNSPIAYRTLLIQRSAEFQPAKALPHYRGVRDGELDPWPQQLQERTGFCWIDKPVWLSALGMAKGDLHLGVILCRPTLWCCRNQSHTMSWAWLRMHSAHVVPQLLFAKMITTFWSEFKRLLYIDCDCILDMCLSAFLEKKILKNNTYRMNYNLWNMTEYKWALNTSWQGREPCMLLQQRPLVLEVHSSYL